ncbi:hypothetical protein GV828_02880 [Flavobacterium sp. NST-5]|uniref:Uncharacterized protein n=1 Tax=Flavobacterium ichthyis TaxID=2698827 RepID=A0ABW9Z613_9FLAO|nr:hypothetical protein [Flavobacterium ichthyis]NBL64141.1 hypothetical protein [Flavobacterium ichthyis]
MTNKQFNKERLIKLFGVMVVLLAMSCQTEEISLQQEIPKNKKPKIVLLEGKEAQCRKTSTLNKLHHRGVLQKEKLLIKNSNLHYRNEDEALEINYDKVMQTEDSYGAIHLTYQASKTDTPENIFYNLVMTEKEGKDKIVLVKYEMEVDFWEEYKISGKMENFRGKVTFTEVASDPDFPCNHTPPIPITVNPGDGSPGGTGGGGSSGGGGTSIGNPSGSAGSPNIPGGSVDDQIAGAYTRLYLLAIEALIDAQNDDEDGDRILTPRFLRIRPVTQITDPSLLCDDGMEVGILEPERDDIIANLIEDQIDDSELDECTKGILNKLKNLQQNDIAKIMKRFDSDLSPFTLKFSQVPNLMHNNQIAYGLCVPSNDNTLSYHIKLNSDYFKNDGATNLGKAATIIHEILHALIASVIQRTQPSTDVTDFPQIWNTYVLIKAGEVAPDDHIFMGNHYVKIMASILQEYDTGVPIGDMENPNQLYMDLAWSGLFKNWDFANEDTSFNQILSLNDKLRISAVKQAEMTNEIVNGTQPTNNAPCIE